MSMLTLLPDLVVPFPFRRLEGVLLNCPLVADAAVIGVYSEEQATDLPRAYSASTFPLLRLFTLHPSLI